LSVDQASGDVRRRPCPNPTLRLATATPADQPADDGISDQLQARTPVLSRHHLPTVGAAADAAAALPRWPSGGRAQASQAQACGRRRRVSLRARRNGGAFRVFTMEVDAVAPRHGRTPCADSPGLRELPDEHAYEDRCSWTGPIAVTHGLGALTLQAASDYVRTIAESFSTSRSPRTGTSSWRGPHLSPR
jgi:hypothetical protein